MKAKEILEKIWTQIWDWILDAEVTVKPAKRGGVDVTVKVGERDDES